MKKKRLTNSYALWRLLVALLLIAGVMEFTPLLGVLMQLGNVPLSLSPLLHLIGMAEVLGTVRLILVFVLILVIVGSLSTFVAYGRSASALNKRAE